VDRSLPAARKSRARRNDPKPVPNTSPHVGAYDSRIPLLRLDGVSRSGDGVRPGASYRAAVRK